jgi:precorrin-6B methylase 2
MQPSDVGLNHLQFQAATSVVPAPVAAVIISVQFAASSERSRETKGQCIVLDFALMVLVRVTDPIDHYRSLAREGDIQALSGHGLGQSVIEFVNSQIVTALELKPEDVLLDIGCGDGSLLKSCQVKRRIGIVPTEEESQRLRSADPEVSFVTGLAQKLSLESAIATKIACNGVLLLLGSESNVLSALREISRVAKPGAKIWIGEIPAENEYERFKIFTGETVSGLLWHRLLYKGFRSFLSTAKSVFTGKVEINSFPLFYSPPEKFIQLADSCGLKICKHSKHLRLDGSGNVMESPFRYNYLFTV